MTFATPVVPTGGTPGPHRPGRPGGNLLRRRGGARPGARLAVPTDAALGPYLPGHPGATPDTPPRRRARRFAGVVAVLLLLDPVAGARAASQPSTGVRTLGQVEQAEQAEPAAACPTTTATPPSPTPPAHIAAPAGRVLAETGGGRSIASLAAAAALLVGGLALCAAARRRDLRRKAL